MKYTVTISRTYGSGGKEIAKELANRLGIKYYGREFLKPVPENDYMDDESVQLSLIMDGDKIDFEAEDEKYRFQSQMILELSEKESCVFVGRCADYVLRDAPNLIKIYLHAKPKFCMKHVMKRYELNLEEAKSLIYSMDKSRGQYYKYHTNQDRDNAVNYDLSLDISAFEPNEVVEILADFIKRRISKF